MVSGLFGFSGRIGRGGWWFGYLVTIACLAIGWALLIFGQGDSEPSASKLVLLFGALIINILAMVIAICITVKRYHDRGKSGWWFWLGLVPIIGGIWQFIELGFCSGDDFENDYGDPPNSEARKQSFEKEMRQMRGEPEPAAATFKAQQASPQPAMAYAAPPPRPTFGKR